MNRKGVIFALDLVLAFSMVVMILGTVYVFYHYQINSVVENKQERGMDMAMNVIMNNLALGPSNCELSNPKKPIAYCFDESKKNKFDLDFNGFNYSVEKIGGGDCLAGECGQIPNNVPFISRSVYLGMKRYSGPYMPKEGYLNCINNTGACDIDWESVRIYVWPK
jgi:hypothetical protein